MEATEQPATSIEAVATAMVEGCSVIAATLFASAAMSF